MNNFKANYNKILEVLKSITEKEQFLKQKKETKTQRHRINCYEFNSRIYEY